MHDAVNGIIEGIKDNSLNNKEYFEIAKLINKLLCNDNNQYKNLARNIVIYLINYWDNIPAIYNHLFTDLVAQCGFYPYMEKEKSKLKSNNLKKEIRKELNRSEHIRSKEDLFFHEAQKEVCDILLNSETNLIVSAPTSFGKSLLIEEIVASKKYKNIVVIQPTLALLNETRNNLRKYDDVYKIIIRVSDKPVEDSYNLFLLTAERVMEYRDLPKIDFFILDEFYKISQNRDDERYEVLNNACNKLLNVHKSRFYFLGPNIDEISEEFVQKYTALFKKYDYSLVVNEEEEIKNGDKFFSDRKVDIKEQRLFEELIRMKEQTIIYCSSPEKSTNTAINFAKYLERLSYKDVNSDNEVSLITWITENLSYKWDVISCLKYKIGLHNGAFPKHINSSIIDYFNEGKLNYLFCTSTIIEGVNTSTKNVIIYNNWRGKPNNKIDYFDYKNIKGRAGRMFKHYVGNVYNFYPPLQEQKIKIDVPFIDQNNPLSKEILAQTPNDLIKNKDSREYKEILALPKEELEIFKSTGLSIDGQKAILDYITDNFNEDNKLFRWTYRPTYEQSVYILELCFYHLMINGETGGGVTPKKLAILIKTCNMVKNLFAVVHNEIKYLHNKKGEDYNTALIKGFQIQRHWFDYKLPKFFGCFNEIQTLVCKRKGATPGDYSYFLAMLENDYMSSRANLLLEFDLPKTAIRKLDSYIPEEIESGNLISYIRDKKDSIANNANLSVYEMERINKEII